MWLLLKRNSLAEEISDFCEINLFLSDLVMGISQKKEDELTVYNGTEGMLIDASKESFTAQNQRGEANTTHHFKKLGCFFSSQEGKNLSDTKRQAYRPTG